MKESRPSRGKRILAVAGIVLLAGMYVATLVCALLDVENYRNLLGASIYATVVVPVLIWAYMFIYRLVKKRDKTEDKV